MNVKFKLALSFAAGGLVLMLLVEYGFSYVISNGQHHRDASLLNHYAKKFSSDLPSYYAQPQSIAQLQAAVATLGAGQLSAILLDKSGRIIAVGPPDLGLDHAANLAQRIGVKALSSSEGYMDICGIRYV